MNSNQIVFIGKRKTLSIVHVERVENVDQQKIVNSPYSKHRREYCLHQCLSDRAQRRILDHSKLIPRSPCAAHANGFRK